MRADETQTVLDEVAVALLALFERVLRLLPGGGDVVKRSVLRIVDALARAGPRDAVLARTCASWGPRIFTNCPWLSSKPLRQKSEARHKSGSYNLMVTLIGVSQIGWVLGTISANWLIRAA